MDNFFDLSNKEYKRFDSRGVFIVLAANKSYIWLGREINKIMEEKYINDY